jgi:hypothetical protein
LKEESKLLLSEICFGVRENKKISDMAEIKALLNSI